MNKDSNGLSFIIFLFILALIIFIIYKFVRARIKHKKDTITCFTGGLGSGKTLLSVDLFRRLYFKQVRIWKRKRKLHNILNLFRRNKLEFDIEKPLAFSNIPVLLNKRKQIYSYRLTKEHLLLQERIPQKSVILLDEIGAFANQFDFKEKNVINVFDEFVRFYRHYTKGGYIICNDQCSENINLVIRRRLNIVHNLSNCFVFWRLCFYYERQINISEEIKTIDMRNVSDDRENDTQDNSVLRFKFLWHKKTYDTYCYSNRYNSVPYNEYDKHIDLKTNKLLKCPKDKEHIYIEKTNND